ncbi:hypothetical protein M422DRAFT_241437 [Sphaerobolus stellatus SS14]|nr:hypothetical protein M422DRAFT_241437 [Sphaerobolus stellatus SS14]
MLSSQFVALWKEVQKVKQENDERSSIPITVRQLPVEAIIRISESLVKMTLSTSVRVHNVEEDIRLFKYPTMDAVSAGNAEGLSRGQLNEEMNRIERDLRRRLPGGWSMSYQSFVKEFVSQQGYSAHAHWNGLFMSWRNGRPSSSRISDYITYSAASSHTLLTAMVPSIALPSDASFEHSFLL